VFPNWIGFRARFPLSWSAVDSPHAAASPHRKADGASKRWEGDIDAMQGAAG
jgi:hypothetical protein